MAILALANLRVREGDLLPGALDGVAVGVVKRGVRGREGDNVPLLEIGDALGQGGERQDVRAEGGGALPGANRKRAAAACADNQRVVLREEEGKRECTLKARQSRAHGREWGLPFCQGVARQAGDDLGVGLRAEVVPLGRELAAQLGVVLDDAVVHNHQRAVRRARNLGRNRVRVLLRWASVRGPARVPQARRAGKRRGRQLLGQDANLALGAQARNLAVGERGQSRRVVAAILEALKCFENLWRRRARA